MLRYLKAAFLIRPDIPGLGKMPVNVLALAGYAILAFALAIAVGSSGLGFGLGLLGLGMETAFVTGLASNARFQKYVDAQRARELRETREGDRPSPDVLVRRMLQSLPGPLANRFESLRRRCLGLRQLAQDLRDPDRAGPSLGLEELQLSGLNRLMWIYLRLLYTQNSLDRFIQETSEGQICQTIKDQEERLRKLPGTADSDQQLKKRKVLEDSLETSRNRLANLQKARENFELVQLEAEQLENKIRALSELAINRHETEFIAGQVEQVAHGMVQTERTMSELQFATGLAVDEEEPPSLLREIAPARQ